MSITRIASRYAKSLIDLAKEQGILEEVKQDVESFREVTRIRDFYLLLKSPIIKSDKKTQIVHQLFKDTYGELTMSFLDILIRKGREMYLPEISEEFVRQYRKMKHISVVKLTTASALDESAMAVIRKTLLESKATSDHVELRTEVDPSLIGGFVVEFDDKLFDSSVAHKLELLKKEFKDNLYVSKIIAH